MKTNPLERLQDIAQRRPLTAAEQAELKELLAAVPSAWPECREEQALTRLLTHLPAATVSSNFSARVMREIAVLETTYQAQRTQFQKDPQAAEQFLKVGESPRPEKSDPIELASLTAVANVLLNLNETITK